MLEKIREGSQGVWAMVILGLVILSFVFAGVGGYITSGGSAAAASVNGDEISIEALERAFQNERARMESQFGDAFAALAADTDYIRQFRQGILDRLIGDKLLEQQAQSLGLRVSDEQIKQTIVKMPEFQIAGQFNNDRYLSLLRQAGFQTSEFRDYMRTDMVRQQVQRALLGSEFSLDKEANELHNLQQQTRDFRFVQISTDLFKTDIQVPEEEARAYYQANLESFDTEEKVQLAYVELKSADLAADVSVSEDDIAAYYQENQSIYISEEERRASHILIEFGEDEAAAEQQAKTLLTRLENGEDFAKLAEENSADTFSAELGGDLDWFAKGVMDPAFESAAFALTSVGDLSQVVKSAFGFHLIKLTDIKASDTKPLEDVSSEIRERLLADKASELYYEKQQLMAELAFEVPDSLMDVSEAVDLPVKESELFTQNAAPAELNDPRILNLAFSSELIEDQVNSDLIELGEGHAIVVRVAQHEPERTKGFDEVQSDVVEKLMNEKAQQAATAWAKELQVEMEQVDSIDEKLVVKSLEWQNHEKQPRFGGAVDRAITEKVFSLSADAPNNTSVVDLINGDVALVELTSVQQGEAATNEQLTALAQRLAANRSNSAVTALIQSLRDQADISVYN